MIDVNGQKYMSTKTAADLWGVKPSTVSEYCRNNKTVNKFKNGRNGWYIQIDEPKPLSQKEIHKLLVLTIQLKDNPSLEIDWSEFTFEDSAEDSAIDNVYKNLAALHYIEPYSIEDKKRIPYEVKLTPKGIEIATSFNSSPACDFSVALSQWLPILINAAQLFIQIYQCA